MDLVSEVATHRFLEGLMFRHGQTIVKLIIKTYNLNPEQAEALEEVLLKPNDWSVKVLPPLSK
jgi:hypothetical protein